MRDPQKKYEKFMKEKEELERGAEAWEELKALFWEAVYDLLRIERICDWLARLLERRHRHGHK